MYARIYSQVSFPIFSVRALDAVCRKLMARGGTNAPESSSPVLCAGSVLLLPAPMRDERDILRTPSLSIPILGKPKKQRIRCRRQTELGRVWRRGCGARQRATRPRDEIQMMKMTDDNRSKSPLLIIVLLYCTKPAIYETSHCCSPLPQPTNMSPHW